MGGAVNRTEPDNIEEIKRNPTTMRIFEQAGWLAFLEQFQGSDHDLVLEFAHNFNGRQTTVRRLTLIVSEESMSKITKLPLQGEKWYKKFKIALENWAQFLKIPSPLPDLRRGIPREALCSPWDEVVFHLQKFITCEGRYSLVHHYHVRILMHLVGEKPMNMPYYLHKSLSKMSEFMRKKKRPETALYHKGLIMMIINAELERMGISWSTFMGQPLTKPRARILPPKKRSTEATTVGCRRSTRVSRKVLGTTSIVEIDTESEEGG
jgi:hypothetical protein